MDNSKPEYRKEKNIETKKQTILKILKPLIC